MKKLMCLLIMFCSGFFFNSYVKANPSKQIDVLILGNQNSGKTALRSVLIGEKFDFLERKYTPTSATNFVADSVVVNGKSVEILFWDSPGHPSVKEQLINEGVKGCQFVVITMDMDKDFSSNPDEVDTFEACLNDWVTIIRRNHPKVYMIVVGTKKDTVSEEEQQRILDSMMPFVNLRTFKGKLDCIITSAFKDKASVEQIKNIIKHHIVEGHVKMEDLPDFKCSSEMKKKIESKEIIVVKNGWCTLL